MGLSWVASGGLGRFVMGFGRASLLFGVWLILGRLGDDFHGGASRFVPLLDRSTDFGKVPDSIGTSIAVVQLFIGLVLKDSKLDEHLSYRTECVKNRSNPINDRLGCRR